MTLARLLTFFLLVPTLAACQALASRVTNESAIEANAAIAVETAAPANDNLNAVAWMQTSVEYRLIAGQTWRMALTQLDRAIKSPSWDALTEDEREVSVAGLPLAVIVDVDETVLDNSSYQARLIRGNASFDEFSWSLWVKEAAAQPVPGALEFARAAAARGVTIYYVSNRAEDLADATVDNLRKAGFPIEDRSQFLGLGTILEGCEESGSEKGCRRKLVGRSHRVLMQVGDQIGDMASVLANTPEGREQAMRPHLAWIGERWFVLPNPSYGSWEPALFNNDWSQAEGERRRQKRAALRY